MHSIINYSYLGMFCFIATDTSLTWNDLYIFLKYCSEIINGLPYEYYNITDMLLNDLMVRLWFKIL